MSLLETKNRIFFFSLIILNSFSINQLDKRKKIHSDSRWLPVYKRKSVCGLFFVRVLDSTLFLFPMSIFSHPGYHIDLCLGGFLSLGLIPQCVSYVCVYHYHQQPCNLGRSTWFTMFYRKKIHSTFSMVATEIRVSFASSWTVSISGAILSCPLLNSSLLIYKTR